MAVVLEVIFVLGMSLLIKLPGVPVAVHRDGLRTPMGPNAEFGVAEPFGAMVLGQGFHGGLEWTGRNSERACVACALGAGYDRGGQKQEGEVTGFAHIGGIKSMGLNCDGTDAFKNLSTRCWI